MAVHGRLSVVLAFVLTGLSTIFVALRFYCRHFLAGKIGASDWVILLALIAAWASVVVNCYVIHFQDYSSVHDRASFASVASDSLLSLWIYRLSYIVNSCLIKMSILLFYKHIASSNKRFHNLVRVLLTILLLGSSSMIVAAVFTCYPVSDAWSFDVLENTFYGIYATQCYNPGPFWIANAAYNVVTDVVIWTMPILFLLNLRNMSLRYRLEMLGVFSVGLLAVVASAARLRVIVLWLSNFVAQGENVANLMIWSQVELNTGIVAGSIPFLRPLYRRILLKARSTPVPVVALVKDSSPSEFVLPRSLIIPSPSPTFDEREDFVMPKTKLPPIEAPKSQYAWGTAIWDGTQVRAVLPT